MALTCKQSLMGLNVGDYVWCKYVATSGTVGVFSDIATKTDAEVASNLIPVASSATPNGYFKFIMSGYTVDGKMKLIPNVNIQHSISWNTINSNGIATGSGVAIDLGFGTTFNTSMRLLTGGTSATDKDNEWDKIIVESTLGGNITSGDNTVWNWDVLFSFTSTVSTTSSSRVVRGNTVNQHTDVPTSLVQANCCFRPVLIVEQLSIIKYLIRDKNNILFKGIDTQSPSQTLDKQNFISNGLDSVLSSMYSFLHDKKILCWTDALTTVYTNTEIKGDRLLNYKTEIKIGSEIVSNYEDTFQSADKTYSIPTNLMASGNNTMTITAKQDNNTEVQKVVTVNKEIQRNYSLKFDGLATSYVSITMPTGFTLTGKTVQVLVKPNGGSWGVRTDSGTFVVLTGTELCIGKSQNCIIDEVRVWETASAITYNDKQLKGNEVGLVALYRFNEFLGNIICDSSPNAYHGNIKGNVIYVNDRYLMQNNADAIITNDIGTGVTILPKDTVYDYNINIISPEMPTANIFTKNKTQEVLDIGMLYTYAMTKTDWKKINGVEIVTLEDGSFASKIVGNKKSLYDYNAKIVETSNNLKDVAKVSYDIVNEGIHVDTSGFTQAITSYTNRITVSQEDGSVVVKDNKFLLYNREPRLILGFVDAMTLFLQIGDDDGDKVKYKLELNGRQIYPPTGYTSLQVTPIIYNQQFKSSEVNVGVMNILKVYTKDQYEGESTHIINFIGEYCGLMFSDETGGYYSSDLGTIIKRLDFGIITAGKESAVKKVILKNTTGYDVTNVKISLDVSTIPTNNIVKLSSQPSPFDSVDSISYPITLKNGQEVPFFVKVKTQVMYGDDGVFVINANATPV